MGVPLDRWAVEMAEFTNLAISSDQLFWGGVVFFSTVFWACGLYVLSRLSILSARQGDKRERINLVLGDDEIREIIERALDSGSETKPSCTCKLEPHGKDTFMLYPDPDCEVHTGTAWLI